MTWRILATQVLTVHVLEDSCNTDTYGTYPVGFMLYRNLQYMAWRILATQVLTVHVLEDSYNKGTVQYMT
jgi:hypothetical protein